jgi:hypothetical protein
VESVIADTDSSHLTLAHISNATTVGTSIAGADETGVVPSLAKYGQVSTTTYMKYTQVIYRLLAATMHIYVTHIYIQINNVKAARHFQHV